MLNNPFYKVTSQYYLRIAYALLEKRRCGDHNKFHVREMSIPNTKDLENFDYKSCIVFSPTSKQLKNEIIPRLIIAFETTDICDNENCTYLVTTARNDFEQFIKNNIIPYATFENYNIYNLYECTETRRALNKLQNNFHDIQLHKYICRNYAVKLSEQLKETPAGKENGNDKKYENIVGDIFELFFDECDAQREAQKIVSNGSYRFDITYYIPPFEDILWDEIRTNAKSSHILIECKNSKEDGELIKAVSQIHKYFTSTMIGNFAIITIRDKSSRKKNKEYIKLLQDREKYIIILDDSDLTEIILEKFSDRDMIILQIDNKKWAFEFSPITKLYKMIVDERLVIA